MTSEPQAFAAADRPLTLRMRPDLVVREVWFRGRRHFVLSDPIATAYAYLTEQEYFILRSLDGHLTTRWLVDQFGLRFAPQQVTAAQLHRFLSQLHRQGLVLSDAPGQGTQLE